MKKQTRIFPALYERNLKAEQFVNLYERSRQAEIFLKHYAELKKRGNNQ